eukprot:2766689-Amphidinium_carterae.1
MTTTITSGDSKGLVFNGRSTSSDLSAEVPAIVYYGQGSSTNTEHMSTHTGHPATINGGEN